MGEFEDMISQMKGNHEEVSRRVEAEKQAAREKHEALRQAGVKALQTTVNPIIVEALKAMEVEGIQYDHKEIFDAPVSPTIELNCKGAKRRWDNSTYEVKGAKVEFSHNGTDLFVTVRQYPYDQKGPRDFKEGTVEDRVRAGIHAALETYFKAISPDQN